MLLYGISTSYKNISSIKKNPPDACTQWIPTSYKNISII